MSDISLNIHDELEKLALKILDLMQRILDERNHFENLFKNGLADMAKTRYVMGTRSVSLLQINESHMMPLYTVQSEECIHNKIGFKTYKIFTNELKSKSTTRQRLHKTADEVTLQNTGNQDDQDNIPIDNKNPADFAGSFSDDEQNIVQNPNPITWFGVLVPQSLRKAQSNFQQSIVSSAHIASLQSELYSLLNTYKTLKLQKKTTGIIVENI